MTEYDIRYFDKRHIPQIYTLLAKDVSHAILQFKELMPGLHMKSVLPAGQWND
tara:strand:- start:392 stop:550 length:159 start_codon:yes stop_codon:yes gene_type:complete